MTFKDLGLSAPILKAVDLQGYTQPSTIQEKAIPHILARKDVLASAQTGTGKTAGFTLPMLEILAASPLKGKRPIRALILTPTRELAAQIYENIQDYSKFLDIKSTVIFGGVNQNPQVNTLRNGIDILVATPGRLLDLYQQKFVALRDVEFLVLDEADRMLDMGFSKDVKRILALLPERRQNLLFSATFSAEIKFFASSILHNPVMVEAEPENSTVDKIEQTAYRVDKGMKPAVLIKMIIDNNWPQALVFTRTKHGANKLSEKLGKAGISSSAIHGNKTQNARTKALDNFKEGVVRVLVATDIAARGLDIPLLPHVVNFELPNVPEDYVHRIGRTGRAGASGEAMALVDADEISFLRAIEKLLDYKIPLQIIKGFEPDPNAVPEKEEPRRFNNRTRENAQRNVGGSGGSRPSGGNNSRPNRSGGGGGNSAQGGNRPQRAASSNNNGPRRDSNASSGSPNQNTGHKKRYNKGGE